MRDWSESLVHKQQIPQTPEKSSGIGLQLVYWGSSGIGLQLVSWVADTQQSRLCHLPEEHRRQLHEMVRMVKQNSDLTLSLTMKELRLLHRRRLQKVRILLSSMKKVRMVLSPIC